MLANPECAASQASPPGTAEEEAPNGEMPESDKDESRIRLDSVRGRILWWLMDDGRRAPFGTNGYILVNRPTSILLSILIYGFFVFLILVPSLVVVLLFS